MPNNNPSRLASLKMPDYSGSWWKERESNLTTMRIGKWTPVLVKDVPASSLFKCKPSIRFESLPMVSPLYNGFTMRTKMYFVPYRLYIPELRKNRQLSWNSVPSLTLPYLNVNSAMASNSYPGYRLSYRGSLLERLGIACGEMENMQHFNNEFVVGRADSGSALTCSASANMLPLLAYIDAWLYGEYNPQDKNIPVDSDRLISFNATSLYQRQYATTYVSYDNLRKFVDAFAYGESISYTGTTTYCGTKTSAQSYFTLSSTQTTLRYQLAPGYDLFSLIAVSTNSQALAYHWNSLRNSVSAVGLLPVTYKGDYFTAWYNEDGVAQLESFIDSIGLGSNVLQLRKNNADFMTRILSLVSGNRWVDYLQYVFDSELELKDHPIMIGFDELDFGSMDILANAQTGDGSTGVLGASASKARNYNSVVKPISCKTKEPGLILCCSAIVPNVVYYQGFGRFSFKRTIADLWHPQYQKQGFQKTFRGEFYSPFAMPRIDAYPRSLAPFVADDNEGQVTQGDVIAPFTPYAQINNTAVSDVPLGWEYMKTYNRVSGGMATEMYKTWSLRRRMDYVGDLRVSYINNSLTGNVIPSYSSGVIDPFSDSAVASMRSTYVDSAQFNESFANVNSAEVENFVVEFSFDISKYQPLAHQLISKTI